MAAREWEEMIDKKASPPESMRRLRPELMLGSIKRSRYDLDRASLARDR